MALNPDSSPTSHQLEVRAVHKELSARSVEYKTVSASSMDVRVSALFKMSSASPKISDMASFNAPDSDEYTRSAEVCRVVWRGYGGVQGIGWCIRDDGV